MAYTIVITNLKGGVSKTTTAVSIADYLDRKLKSNNRTKNKKVLLVDCESQRDATMLYGAEYKGVPTIYDIFMEGESGRNCIQHTACGDIIPGDTLLRNIEKKLDEKLESEGLTDVNKNLYLKKALADLQKDYEYIVVDTPPHYGLLLSNALELGSEGGIIIPMAPDYLNVQGLADACEMIEDYKRDFPNMRVLGALVVNYNPNIRLKREIVNVLPEIAKDFDITIFKQKVRFSTKLAEAQSNQMRLSEYAPDSNPAKDYEKVVDEMLKVIKNG